jgi:hypothetical protein
MKTAMKPIETTPQDIQALLNASRSAQDPHTALEYAQRAVDALPDDPQVQESVQRSIFSTLKQDAFVAFLAETEKHYVITFRNSRPVVVPKARTQPEVFPDRKQTDGERAQSMLWWVVLGLLPVGIGTLILSPLTIGHAIDVLWRGGTDSREKRLALVSMVLAGILGLFGMLFTLLLVLHLIG